MKNNEIDETKRIRKWCYRKQWKFDRTNSVETDQGITLPAATVAVNGGRRWLKKDPMITAESDRRSWAILFLEALYFLQRVK